MDEVTQLDLLALANRSLPRRIKTLERAQRRTGIRSAAIQSSTPSTPPALTYGGVAKGSPDPATQLPRGATSTPELSQQDGSPVNIPPRPNYVRNGSFEYYQNGDTAPYAWVCASAVHVAPTFQTMDGLLVLQAAPAATFSQVVGESATFGAGSWVFSAWVRGNNVGGVVFNVSTDDTNQVVGDLFFVTSAGTSTAFPTETDQWVRVYRQVITGQAALVTLSLGNGGATNLWLDAAKLEVEVGETGFILPTEYTPDALSGTTIIRELKADNIVAGTLTVGGSGSTNPVIEVYDGADVLIATLGAPSGGYRGLNVKGQAGVRVEPGGSLVAGSFELTDAGLKISPGSAYAADRSVKFLLSDGTNYASINGKADGTAEVFGLQNVLGPAFDTANSPLAKSWLEANASTPYLQGVAGTKVESTDATGGNVTSLLTYTGKSAIPGPGGLFSPITAQSETASKAISGRSLIRTKATQASGVDTNTVELIAGELTAAKAEIVLSHTVTVPGGAEATSIALNASSILLNGTAPLSAPGTLSGSTANGTVGAEHFHAVDAYSSPGTTANRILKTGTLGAVVLADLAVTAFSLNGRVHTSSISGVLAVGAGSLTGSTTNDVTVNGHTHAVDAYDTPGTTANRILKSGTAGLLTLAALTVTSFTLGSAVLTASVSGNVALGAATLTGATTNDATIASHTHAVDSYATPGATAGRILKTGTAGLLTLAALTVTTLTLGSAVLTASVSGNVALGAGTLTGATTNDATIAGHVHAVDAYSAPGTTANRILKTGTLGAVVLADVQTTLFSLNGRPHTSSISGNLAVSAGTLTGTSTNDDTLNGHTHAITAFDTPGATANRILKSGTAGLLTLAALTVTTFTLGSAVLTASASGAVAVGAGTLTAATTNSTSSSTHTHGITTSSTAANSTIVTTDGSGYHTAKLSSGSVIDHAGWTAPTLLNSWVNFGSPYQTAAYCKDQMGYVHLRGLVKSGTLNANIMTLPSGFQPTAGRLMYTTLSGGASPVATRIDIDTSGNVFQQSATVNAFQSLDGISFYAG